MGRGQVEQETLAKVGQLVDSLQVSAPMMKNAHGGDDGDDAARWPSVMLVILCCAMPCGGDGGRLLVVVATLELATKNNDRREH